MTPIQLISIYGLLGLFAARIMFLLFRPVGSYRPSISIRVAAAITFSLLWPIIFLLAVCYAVGWSYRKRTGEEGSIADAGLPIFHRPYYEDIG